MNLSKDKELKTLIFSRMKEIGMKDTDLLNDADERGYFINKSQFSKWKNDKRGGINDHNVFWIMERLGIQYNVNFGTPLIKNGKLIYEIQPYNEGQALKRLNILFKRNG